MRETEYNWRPTCDILEDLTREYWRLSLAARGKTDESVTIAYAIGMCGALHNSLGPQRHLRYVIPKLLNLIVVGGRKRKSLLKLGNVRALRNHAEENTKAVQSSSEA